MGRTAQNLPLSDNQTFARTSIDGLCDILKTYLTNSEVSEVYKAYLFGAEAHSDQKRLSGEPYIHHPLEVAYIMAELQLDATTITASILHDVIEDTGTTKAQLAEEFGQEVAEVVDGVSKLEELAFESTEVKQARNFQKMMLAIAKDIRVILVKLADRLHNMRTIEHMRHDKQKKIARETLEIYAPLAYRVGIEKLAAELEELAFAVMYPLRYQVIKQQIESLPGDKSQMFSNLVEKISQHYHSQGMECEVQGRKKNIYSTYKKMKDKKLSLSKIADLFAIRIIVADVDSCYRALGIIHGFLRPVPGRFKDYIALPKSNGYQSLHTVLFGPQGIAIEVQIRTVEMNHIAVTGIAAHPHYKVSNSLHNTIQAQFQNLSHLKESADDASGYMESLRAELAPDNIYVFTPDGEVIALPLKATALDFAFAIHTDIGLATLKIKINDHAQPLDKGLRSGQTISVITDDAPCPRPEWLNFVVTAKARNAIHQYLKHTNRAKATQLGKAALNQALNKYHLHLDTIDAAHSEQVVHLFGAESMEDLCCAIGMAQHVPQVVATRLATTEESEKSLALALQKLLSEEDHKGMVIHYPKCCYPLPGDDIVAIPTTERGIVVHRNGCSNSTVAPKQESSLIRLHWTSDKKADSQYYSEIRAHTPHKRGALAKIATVIANSGSNIEHIIFEEQQGEIAVILFTLTVKDKDMLLKLMKKISKKVADTDVYRVGLKLDNAQHPEDHQ